MAISNKVAYPDIGVKHKSVYPHVLPLEECFHLSICFRVGFLKPLGTFAILSTLFFLRRFTRSFVNRSCCSKGFIFEASFVISISISDDFNTIIRNKCYQI